MNEIRALEKELIMMEHNDTSPELNATIPLVFDDEDEFEDDPMVSPFLFQGDILLNEIQMDNFLGIKVVDKAFLQRDTLGKEFIRDNYHCKIQFEKNAKKMN
uniref:Reverse transcriptase domain-containing protein n=1 Tax=Rhabditophanes sp. KR3021 TaxID=114890 RepID=A0AC35TPV9_9BILA